MSSFWILATIMTLWALLFAVLPLFRKHSLQDVDHNQLNAVVIKEQLQELKADLEAGKLEASAYDAARHDLERELLSNLETEGGGAPQQHQGRWAIGLFSVLIPGLALFVYLQLGTPDFIAQQENAVSANANQQGHPLADMVEVLAQRLREEPDRLDGWLLLGRSYATLKQFDKAAEAYAQARRIAGDTPELLIDLADMQVMANGGRFTPEVGGLLEAALQSEPDNPKGRWLLGHYKYQHNDLQAAIDNWQRAAALLPPEGDNVMVIKQQIARAREELGGAATEPAPAVAAAPVAAAAAPDSAAAPASIQVSVDLDPTLRDKVSAQDTLFVFARATQGPRMPLAIVRKQVADLPVTVTLNDSQAMTPAMVLSNFAEVTVGARVSKSGNAMPQAGDLEGMQSPVRVGTDSSIAITINRLVP